MLLVEEAYQAQEIREALAREIEDITTKAAREIEDITTKTGSIGSVITIAAESIEYALHGVAAAIDAANPLDNELDEDKD